MAMVSRSWNLQPSPPSRHALTRREQQICRMASEGKSGKEIASVLAISPRTVKFHLTNVYRKLGISNQLELIVKFRNSAADKVR